MRGKFATDGVDFEIRSMRMPRLWVGIVLVTTALTAALLPLGAQQQPTGKDGKEAKQDASKPPAKEMKQPDGKMADKNAKPNDVAVPGPMRPTLDRMKLPTDALVIIVEKVQEAAELIPYAIQLKPEAYQKLMERIRVLEQQLKPEKATTHSCKLTGRLDGDYLALRAEFTFATLQPKSTVVLGLQGAHLVDEGDLDKTAPSLDYGDDGFVVRVDKEGAHQLILNLKTPLVAKKSATAGAPAERGFDLGLPGAPATTLSLELPAGIKEVRINESLKKSKTPGRWDVPLGLAKQVSVAWREQQALTGGEPLLKLDAQIVARLEATAVQLEAELVLEDLRGRTTEWRLLLPPEAKPTVKSLPASAYQWTIPKGKDVWHVLQLKEPTSERITVTVQVSAPRSAAKVAVGPFSLAGAFQQQGSVLVQSTPDALRGQRLIYHRQGDVTQRDLPAAKGPMGVENLAAFQYAVGAATGPAATKPPLELEIKASSGLAETQTDHTVRLKGENGEWHVETTTRIQAKSLAEVTDHLDVQLPRARSFGLESLGVAPALAFPGLAPWLSLTRSERQLDWAAPLEFRREEDGSELIASDAGRRARVRWSRQNGKQFALIIHGKYAVPRGAASVRVELPRPLGNLDRGGSLTVDCGPQVELLMGPPGAEEAVPERQHWHRLTETAPASVDVAWRPFSPAFVALAVSDVVVHETSAHVRQRLQFSAPSGKGGASAGNVRLRLPPGIRQVTLEAGGKLLGEPNADTGLVWLAPQADATGKCELLLEFDVSLPKRDDGADPAAPLTWQAPIVWPESATRREAKVRVWTAPGTIPTLAPAARAWHERGVESVEKHDGLPALVVRSADVSEPLILQMRPAGQSMLASLLCDRTLIKVHIDEEGNQLYRARFLIRKLAVRQLTLELPVPVRDSLGDNLQAIRFGPDRQEKTLPWSEASKTAATFRLAPESFNAPGQPMFLEVEYKVPASFAEGRHIGQTILYPPRWQGEVLPGTVRWQVEFPADQVALVLSGGATLDYRWALHGWLLAPEASVTGAELDAWLTGRESGEAAPADLVFWRPGLGTQRVVHLSRQAWLLICSGLVLILGLALFLLPLPRWLRWFIVAAIGAGIVAAALYFPAAAPAIVYGCEPGLVVLALLIGLQWMLQERYRRQVVVMPGFARLQTGSSLSRGAGPKAREPSTVDSPLAPTGAVPSSIK